MNASPVSTLSTFRILLLLSLTTSWASLSVFSAYVEFPFDSAQQCAGGCIPTRLIPYLIQICTIHLLTGLQEWLK